MLKVITNTIINRVTVITQINQGVCNKIPPKNTANQENKMNKKKFMKILIKTGVFLKESGKDFKPFLVTITTKNNTNSLTHLECKKILGRWLDLRKKQGIINAFIWWAEIQHNKTKDIHFHCIVFSQHLKPFNIPNEVEYLTEKFPTTNTNVINIKPIVNDASGVLFYMLSYMKKFRVSWIVGKVAQLSYAITQDYKKHCDKYIISELHSDNIMKYITNKKIFSNEFVTSYYLNIFDENLTGKAAHSLSDIRANKMSALPVGIEF